MAQESFAELMRRETARAIPWGVMLLVVIVAGSMWVKQEVKEGVEFTFHAAVKEIKQSVLSADTFVPIKQNVKESIEFAIASAIRHGKKAVLDDKTFVPIKQNVKEAIEFTARTAANEYKRVQKELKAGK